MVVVIATALSLVSVATGGACAGFALLDPRALGCLTVVQLAPRGEQPRANESAASPSTGPGGGSPAERAPVFRPSDCADQAQRPRPAPLGSDASSGLAPASFQHDVCLVTSLSSEYLDGHEVFIRTLAAHARAAPSAAAEPVPLFVFEDGLSAAERQRVCSLYEQTILLPLPRSVPAGIPLDRGSKWASNLRKLFALFELGPRCAALVKVDTGDMLVLRDPSELLKYARNGTGRVLMAQALSYKRNLNGGLAVFQRGTLTRATRDALVRVGTAKDSYREQWLLRKWLTCGESARPAFAPQTRAARAPCLQSGSLLYSASACSPPPCPCCGHASSRPVAFSALLVPLPGTGPPPRPATRHARSGRDGGSIYQELPKRFNVEWSYWSPKAAGPHGLPAFDETVLLHYVGDKPWMRRTKGPAEYDGLWWSQFARGRMLVVGSSPTRGPDAQGGGAGPAGAGGVGTALRGAAAEGASGAVRSRGEGGGAGWRVGETGWLLNEEGAPIQQEGWLVARFEHVASVGAVGRKAARGGAAAQMAADEPGAGRPQPEGRLRLACELSARLDAEELLACLASAQPRGVFTLGLGEPERGALRRAWALHVAGLCTEERPCAAGGGGRPLLDVEVRALEPMRVLAPPKVRRVRPAARRRI